jgi:hypothetical protein
MKQKLVIKGCEPNKKVAISIRIDQKDLLLLKRKAKLYSRGNLSALLINSAKLFVPKRKDLVELDEL